MKVLRHGWNYYKANDEHIVQCRQCECEFQYQDKDTYIRELYDMYYNKNVFCRYVDCPECGYDNHICTHQKFE